MLNKEVFIIGMIAGLIIGAAFGITLVVSTAKYGKATKYERAIYQCEQALPRNVHCIITAIVEKPDE